MNQFWKDMGIAVTMGLLLPAVLLAGVVSIATAKNEIPLLTEPIVQMNTTEPTNPQMKISVLGDDGQVMQLPLDDYLTCVTLAEMPVSFEDEAIKAQTVVARTYTMRAVNGASKHSEASVCTNSSCCQGYLSVDAFLAQGGEEKAVQRIRDLVESTDCQVLTYDGNLIEATYFSCSGGITEDAVAVWGTDVPYLQSVASPGEEQATYYTDTARFAASDFASKLGMDLTGKPSTWFGATTHTEGGGIATMTIGDQIFTGTELRKLLELRSTAFEVAVDSDSIVITTRGYGHRVGMSQYGADAMATGGCTYPEILAYYYQGTELTQYAD